MRESKSERETLQPQVQTLAYKTQPTVNYILHSDQVTAKQTHKSVVLFDTVRRELVKISTGKHPNRPKVNTRK